MSSHEFGTNLSSFPSSGFFGSGSLFSVLQPFKPLTDAPVTEACMEKAIDVHFFSLKYLC